MRLKKYSRDRVLQNWHKRNVWNRFVNRSTIIRVDDVSPSMHQPAATTARTRPQRLHHQRDRFCFFRLLGGASDQLRTVLWWTGQRRVAPSSEKVSTASVDVAQSSQLLPAAFSHRVLLVCRQRWRHRRRIASLRGGTPHPVRGYVGRLERKQNISGERR